MAIRVIAVDDHYLVRAGIRSTLAPHGDVQLVAEGESGADVYPLVQEYRPDILLLDLDMPAYSPRENTSRPQETFAALPTIARLKHEFPGTKVIIISQYDSKTLIEGAFEVGVKGYILKRDALTRNLVEAIRMVHWGGVYFSSVVLNSLESLEANSPSELLTPRQCEVLQVLAASPGLTQERQAEQLGIAVSTLKKHLNHIYRILGVSNSTAAIMKAVQLHIIPLAYLASVNHDKEPNAWKKADRSIQKGGGNNPSHSLPSF
jgi:DNA-binding NarL/FixJ family response regulator